MFIHSVPEDQATGEVAEMYRRDRESWGFLPTFTQAFSHHPDAFNAWRQLISSISGRMDRRRFELATLAAARALRSDCCSVAHGKFLTRFHDQETVRQIAIDPSQSALDDVDVAIMSFAEKVAQEPAAVVARDLEALRELGLSDQDIFDVVLAVGARCFFATVIEAVGVTPEAELANAMDDALVDVLLVGRAKGG